jgi:hypothetical protein
MGGWGWIHGFYFIFGKDREERRKGRKVRFLGALMEVIRNLLCNVLQETRI